MCVCVCVQISVGGQKCRWNDLIQRDLVRCGIEQDWRELAQDRSAWRGIVEMSVNIINEEFEKKEDKKKDERKKSARHILPLPLPG